MTQYYRYHYRRHRRLLHLTQECLLERHRHHRLLETQNRLLLKMLRHRHQSQ
jgi:hypothetical protein